MPGGAAEVDGRLLAGDEIMYVNGQCVGGSSHHRVVQLMGQSGVRGVVSLVVRRRLGGPPLTLPNGAYLGESSLRVLVKKHF